MMPAVTAVYVVFVELFIHREIPFKQLPRIMHEAMLLVGGILVILGLSLASARILECTENRGQKYLTTTNDRIIEQLS
jgi:TRAP-type C4-dicarboxylate transport system permease large subunit